MRLPSLWLPYFWHFPSILLFFFSFSFFSFTEVWLSNKNCIYLRCTMWCLNVHMHCKMITTIKLINIFITSYSYLFCVCVSVCVVRILKIYSLNRFQAYNILTIDTIIYIRSPELIYIMFVPFDQHLPTSPTSMPW